MNIADAVKEIAAEWHGKVVNADGSIGQRRKYSDEPYTVHTNAVRNIYQNFFPDDITGQAIAEGHDLLEDTALTAVELFRLLQAKGFSNAEIEPVVSGIVHLTDVFVKEKYPKVNRAGRKAMELARQALMPAREQNIKTIDVIHNTDDIVKNDPNFAKVYLKEKDALLNVLGQADPRLLRLARSQIITAATLEKTSWETIRQSLTPE